MSDAFICWVHSLYTSERKCTLDVELKFNRAQKAFPCLAEGKKMSKIMDLAIAALLALRALL